MYGKSQQKATYNYRKDKHELRTLVDLEYKKNVEEFCQRHNLSVSQMMRMAIEEYMKNNSK